MASSSVEVDEGVLRGISDTPPAHYLLKLESFSLFSENGVKQIRSNSFQVGEYQWKIILFPNGNNGGKDDHVSVYLMLDSTSSLPAGKSANAIFKFFLFDQIRGNYLTVQGKSSRFDRLKCEWGFDKFISLEALTDPTNVSQVANISGRYKWVITHFSELGEFRCSDKFVVGGYTWKLLLYPNGVRNYKGFSLSMYLLSVDSKSSTTEHEVKAELWLKLNDQFKKNHIQKQASVWFGASRPDWGFHSFIELKDLKDDKEGYVVADQCIIEAEVTVLCEGSRETLKC